MIISLSSILTENLTFDMSYGENEFNRTVASSTANLPPIYDNRGSNSFAYRSGAANFDYPEFPEVAAHVKLNIRVFNYTCRYSILHGRKIM